MDTFEHIAAMQQRIARLRAETESLKEVWNTFLPSEWLPSDRQFMTWLGKYDYSMNAYGIETASNRLNRKECEAGEEPIQWNKDACVKFISGVMKQETLRGDAEDRKYAAMAKNSKDVHKARGFEV